METTSGVNLEKKEQRINSLLSFKMLKISSILLEYRIVASRWDLSRDLRLLFSLSYTLLSSSDCRHHLCEPDMKLVWPSAKLLQAAAGGSLRAYYQITSSVFPLLVEQYNKHLQVSRIGLCWSGKSQHWNWAAPVTDWGKFSCGFFCSCPQRSP